MHPQIVEAVLRFGSVVRRALPLMQRLDTAACLASIRALDPSKQTEWALRSRCPLRAAVGVFAGRPDAVRDAFAADAETHTVLCLCSDLIDGLPAAVQRIPMPDLELHPPGPLHPVQEMNFVHAALYWAESLQDAALGLPFCRS